VVIIRSLIEITGLQKWAQEYILCVHRRAQLQIILSVRYASPGSDLYLMHVMFPAIVVKAMRLPKIMKTRV